MDNENYKFLLEIGFTLNEAKVYLTLLQNRYLNGYETSKLSNVSRSLVYDVIDRLVAKGFLAAHQIGDGKCRFHRIKS